MTRARRQRLAPAVGLSKLLEVVPVELACDDFGYWWRKAAREREELGLSIAEAARFGRVPATQLVEVLSGRRAFATQDAYGVLVDRFRAAARHRARVAAGEASRRPGAWR